MAQLKKVIVAASEYGRTAYYVNERLVHVASDNSLPANDSLLSDVFKAQKQSLLEYSLSPAMHFYARSNNLERITNSPVGIFEYDGGRWVPPKRLQDLVALYRTYVRAKIKISKAEHQKSLDQADLFLKKIESLFK